MTVNEIIVAALSELGRGHDQRSIDNFRHKFIRFINDGMLDIALSMKLHRTEEYVIDGSTIDTIRLKHNCIKVVAVTQDGFPLRFSVCEASDIVSVRGTGTVNVTYRYTPRVVSVPADVPEIPEYLHGLIVSYVVGRERMSGDTGSQRGANAYMDLYEMMKLRVLSATNTENEIDNKW